MCTVHFCTLMISTMIWLHALQWETFDGPKEPPLTKNARMSKEPLVRKNVLKNDVPNIDCIM